MYRRRAERRLASLIRLGMARTDRRQFAVRITSYSERDIFIPFEWNVTAAEVTERVRAAMDD
jgi:hypothetical protein